jgi:Xaa-Pro aminopeptidase
MHFISDMFFSILILIALGCSFVNGADENNCTWNSTQKNTSAILANLREEMRNENISIYVIFPDDEHGSEYTQPYDKRRDWLTGFRGSAGIAVVSWRSAALWTDGRYFTQAEEQLDCENWLLMRTGNPGVPSLIDWLVTESNDTTLVRFYSR